MKGKKNPTSFSVLHMLYRNFSIVTFSLILSLIYSYSASSALIHLGMPTWAHMI